MKYAKSLWHKSNFARIAWNRRNRIVIRLRFERDFYFRLIKHTEKLLEDREEKLCIKVLQTLREMMTVHVCFQKVGGEWRVLGEGWNLVGGRMVTLESWDGAIG